MFCGNPLAGGKPVDAGGNAAAAGSKADRKKDADQRWDPETAYIQSKGRKIALLIAAVLLVAVVSAIYVSQPKIFGISRRAFDPPLGTPGASGLTEITSLLKEAGLKPRGNPYQFSDTIYQQFDASVILGEETDFSIAEEKGNRIAVSHAFTEDKTKFYTFSKPGPVFERLLKKLSDEFGQPVIRGAEDYYYWTKGNDMLALYYGYDNVIWIRFYEEYKAASV